MKSALQLVSEAARLAIRAKRRNAIVINWPQKAIMAVLLRTAAKTSYTKCRLLVSIIAGTETAAEPCCGKRASSCERHRNRILQNPQAARPSQQPKIARRRAKATPRTPHTRRRRRSDVLDTELAIAIFVFHRNLELNTGQLAPTLCHILLVHLQHRVSVFLIVFAASASVPSISAHKCRR